MKSLLVLSLSEKYALLLLYIKLPNLLTSWDIDFPVVCRKHGILHFCYVMDMENHKDGV